MKKRKWKSTEDHPKTDDRGFSRILLLHSLPMKNPVGIDTPEIIEPGFYYNRQWYDITGESFVYLPDKWRRCKVPTTQWQYRMSLAKQRLRDGGKE